MIFDAHLDLAMNALEWNRDLRRPLPEIRQREKDLSDKPDRGNGTVSFPEMRKAGIGICVATQIARYVAPTNPLPGWNSPEQAWAQTQGQLAWYREMERAGELRQITGKHSLESHLSGWRASEGSGSPHPIGYILSLEGADSIVTLKHLERSFEAGLRAVGPAHYGPGRYAQGTDADGGLTPEGRDLLREMDRLGLILDATHLCDASFWEALNLFQGPVWASHSLPRSLTPHNRQFTDEQIKALASRNAVLGMVFDAWMMIPNWIRGKTRPETAGLRLEKIIEHVDHIAQLLGNTDHIGIGSDLDGAFGTEQTPADLSTIADLAKIPVLLSGRGYSTSSVEQIMHGNFLKFLREVWE